MAAQVDKLVEQSLVKHLEAVAGPLLEAAVEKHVPSAIDVDAIAQRVAVAAASAVREASGKPTAALGALAVAHDLCLQLPAPKSVPGEAPAATSTPAAAAPERASPTPVNGLNGPGRVRRQRDGFAAR